MAQPTPEHKRLAETVGKWNVKCEFFMGPDQKMEMDATDTAHMLGNFWLICDFKGDMMGMPFEGRATTGFNPATGKWVSTWIDTMTPYLYSFEGVEEGAVRTFHGPGPHPHDGSMVEYRTREEAKSDGSRVFEMFCIPNDGPEFQMFRHTYTRA